MTITLRDQSKVLIDRLNDGRQRIAFKGIGQVMVMPVATTVTVALLERMYVLLAKGI